MIACSVLAPEVAEGISRFKAIAATAFGPRLRQVVLFGSQATGRVHEDSDVDLLLLVEPREAGDGRRATDAAVAVMLDLPDVLISPLVLTPEELRQLRERERLLARDIDRDGIVL